MASTPEDFLDPLAQNSIQLPTIAQLRSAVEQYLRKAYAPPVPPSALRFLPPEDAEPVQWLMADPIERDPADAPLQNVHSFAMRVGNRRYLNMKIRLTRPPRQSFFVFSIDAHDAVLHAPAGSPDESALRQLKLFNAQLGQEVLAVWEAMGLPTERTYMRQQIRQARDRNANR